VCVWRLDHLALAQVGPPPAWFQRRTHAQVNLVSGIANSPIIKAIRYDLRRLLWLGKMLAVLENHWPFSIELFSGVG
jgi:hypothetical protein